MSFLPPTLTLETTNHEVGHKADHSTLVMGLMTRKEKQADQRT